MTQSKDDLRNSIFEPFTKIVNHVSNDIPKLVGIDSDNFHITQALYRLKEALFWIDEAIYNSVEEKNTQG